MAFRNNDHVLMARPHVKVAFVLARVWSVVFSGPYGSVVCGICFYRRGCSINHVMCRRPPLGFFVLT